MSSKPFATVGDRYRWARKQIGNSQEEFAQALGVSLRSYQSYERNETQFPAEVFGRAEEHYGIRALWANSGTGLPFLDDPKVPTHLRGHPGPGEMRGNTQRIANIIASVPKDSGSDDGRGRSEQGPTELSSEDVAHQLDDDRRSALKQEIAEQEARYGVSLEVGRAIELVRSGEYVWVPFYDVHLSAGHGTDFLERPTKWNFYRREYLVDERGLDPVNLCEAMVRGTSMVPELFPRDTVMIDRGRTEIEDGDIYWVRVDSMLYIKFLQRLPNGDVQASSKQAAENPPFVIPRADFQSKHAEVIGRLCRSARDR